MAVTVPAAIMDVSPAVYEELKARFAACEGLSERLIKVGVGDDGSVVDVLNMNNIALRRETDQRVQVWLIFDGERLNKPKRKRGKMLPPEGTKA